MADVKKNAKAKKRKITYILCEEKNFEKTVHY